MGFLPVTREEMELLGWEQADFVLVTGDAYIDHPSFGAAIISRVLEANGYKVAVLAQPDWKDVSRFRIFGRPRLGFLITSGNVDSMVAHYSVFKKRRREDRYSPGGIAGKRPDRAVIVYAGKAREAYKDVPVIIGGLEASLRRLGHYDYWDDKVRRSILLDAKADLLIYGMAEKTIIEVADALEAGIACKDITWPCGIVYKKVVPRVKELEFAGEKELKELDFESAVGFNIEGEFEALPDYDDICANKEAYARSFAAQHKNNVSFNGKVLTERYGETVYVVQNPPGPLLSETEMDRIYELPYEGRYHPIYEKAGGVPAVSEVRFSITSSRGCFGGCSFCALTFHQGRVVQSRSKTSIVAEAGKLAGYSDFKGYIHDVGGPTANFRKAACAKQKRKGACIDRDCLYPEPCSQLEVNHGEYLDILREIRRLPGVKKVFIRSGIRFDYAVYDRDHTFIRELARYHVSGVLKVAPEHVSKKVLKAMRKPGNEIFQQFKREYYDANRRFGLKQYLIPYFISSHPGSGLKEAVELAEYLKKEGFLPDQVQDFYPTPGTLATCMYHTGLDPLTMEKVYVPKDLEEKRMQRALLHFHKKENAELVRKALILAGREDLIGYGQNCIVNPKGGKAYSSQAYRK